MARERYIKHTEITVGSECDQTEIKEKVHIKPKFGGFFGFHIWNICALQQNAASGGGIIIVPFGTVLGPFTFWGNPLWQFLNPINVSVPPYYGVYMNYFYDWVVTQVGPIVIGDKIEIDLTVPQTPWPKFQAVYQPNPIPSNYVCTSSMTGGQYSGGTEKICFEYMGVCQGPMTPCWPNSSGVGVSNTQLGVTLNGCDCKYFGLGGDAQIAGWDCKTIQIIQTANLLGSPAQCVPRFYPVTGTPPQFATKLDCTNSGCGKPPTTIPQPIGVGP